MDMSEFQRRLKSNLLARQNREKIEQARRLASANAMVFFNTIADEIDRVESQGRDRVTFKFIILPEFSPEPRLVEAYCQTFIDTIRNALIPGYFVTESLSCDKNDERDFQISWKDED